jgi:hypothetical protein
MSPGHQLVQARADNIPPVTESAVNVNLLFLIRQVLFFVFYCITKIFVINLAYERTKNTVLPPERDDH